MWRTRAIPRVPGALLMLGGAGAVLNVFGELLIPGYATTLLFDYATLPASLGEIGSGLWLVLFGLDWEQVRGAARTVDTE